MGSSSKSTQSNPFLGSDSMQPCRYFFRWVHRHNCLLFSVCSEVFFKLLDLEVDMKTTFSGQSQMFPWSKAVHTSLNTSLIGIRPLKMSFIKNII